MRTSHLIILIVTGALVLIITPAEAGQKSETGVAVPKYDPAVEATFKGTRGKRPPMPDERWYGIALDLAVVSQPDH
jgi:hypothetical protein